MDPRSSCDLYTSAGAPLWRRRHHFAARVKAGYYCRRELPISRYVGKAPRNPQVASVYTSPEAAQAAADSGRSTARGAVAALPEDGVAVAMGGGAKKRKKSRAKPKTAASGFGAAPAAASTAPKKLWCPALGLEKQADVVLVVGRLDGAAAAAVDAVADELGDEVAMILCSTRVEHACHVEAGSRHRRGVARG